MGFPARRWRSSGCTRVVVVVSVVFVSRVRCARILYKATNDNEQQLTTSDDAWSDTAILEAPLLTGVPSVETDEVHRERRVVQQIPASVVAGSDNFSLAPHPQEHYSMISTASSFLDALDRHTIAAWKRVVQGQSSSAKARSQELLASLTGLALVMYCVAGICFAVLLYSICPCCFPRQPRKTQQRSYHYSCDDDEESDSEIEGDNLEAVHDEEHEACLRLAGMICGPIQKSPSSGVAGFFKSIKGRALDSRYIAIQLASHGKMWRSAMLAWWKNEKDYRAGNAATNSIPLKDVSSVQTRDIKGDYPNGIVLRHCHEGQLREMFMYFPSEIERKKFIESINDLVARIRTFNRRGSLHGAAREAQRHVLERRQHEIDLSGRRPVSGERREHLLADDSS